MGLSRTVLRYKRRGERDYGALRSRILLFAAQRRPTSYRRIHGLLHRDGLAVKCKRVPRIYSEERLQVTRRKRRLSVVVKR
jgi:putative transposase